MPNPNLPPELEPLVEQLKPVVQRSRETFIRKNGTKDGRPQYTADIDQAIVEDVLLAIAPRIQGMVAAEREQCIWVLRKLEPLRRRWINREQAEAALRARHAGESPDGR